MAEAADLGSQLVVFPEAFVGGYPRGNSFGAVVGSRSAKGREDYRKYHASAIDVPGLSSCILLFSCCNLDSVVQCCNSSPNPKSWKLSLCKGNFAVSLQMNRRWRRRTCWFLHLGLSCFLLFCCNLHSVVQCCNSYPNSRSWKLSLYKEKLDSNFAVFYK